MPKATSQGKNTTAKKSTLRTVAPAQTPPPPDPPKQPCPHKYALAETVKNAYDNKDGMTTWTRVNRFFCQICLDQKETMKSEIRKTKPEWY